MPPLPEHPQLVNGLLWLTAFEHIAATHQHIGTSLYQQWCCFGLHTSINLYQRLASAFVNHLA